MKITVVPHRIDSYPDKFEFYLQKDGLNIGKLFGVDKDFVELIASAPSLLSERDELKHQVKEKRDLAFERAEALISMTSQRDELKKEVERLKELKDLLWEFPSCYDSDPDDGRKYMELKNKAIAIESLLKK